MDEGSETLEHSLLGRNDRQGADGLLEGDTVGLPDLTGLYDYVLHAQHVLLYLLVDEGWVELGDLEEVNRLGRILLRCDTLLEVLVEGVGYEGDVGRHQDS